MRMRLIKLIYVEPENMILSTIWLWFVLLFSDFQTTNVFFNISHFCLFTMFDG